MVIIARTHQGRILVREFEIERNVYLFLNEFYPQLTCYAVKYNDSILDIYIKNQNNINTHLIEKVQNEAKFYFEEKMGIYFKTVNINIY